MDVVTPTRLRPVPYSSRTCHRHVSYLFQAKQLEIRIGVVTHTLVAKKLKQNITTRQEAAVPKNNHIQHDTYMDDDFED